MRLIDADRLSENIYDNISAPYEDSREAKEECLCAIEEAPTIDAVPVVRCKDCKYRDGTPGQPNILCAQMHEDDFCSYGERKEEPHDRLQKDL
jgi:hypothetical protein